MSELGSKGQKGFQKGHQLWRLRDAANMKTTALGLRESHIRYAMENTKSNRSAAAFLNVNYKTYQKYAKRYIDFATQLTLWALHIQNNGRNYDRSERGRARRAEERARKELEKANKPKKHGYEYIYPEDIYNNNTKKWKNPLSDKFIIERLLKHNEMSYCCTICGFSEGDVWGKGFLKLDRIDGDVHNNKLDNLRLLCLNHYYIYCGYVKIGKISQYKYFDPAKYKFRGKPMGDYNKVI